MPVKAMPGEVQQLVHEARPIVNEAFDILMGIKAFGEISVAVLQSLFKQWYGALRAFQVGAKLLNQYVDGWH